MKKIFLFFFLYVGTQAFSQCVFDWGTVFQPRLSTIVRKDHAHNIITIEYAGATHFIIKRRSTGAVIFIKPIDSSYEVNIRDLAIDEHNNIYVCGDFRGNMQINSNTITEAYSLCHQGFVFKLDALGNTKWIQHSTGNYGSSGDGDDDISEISVDTAGNCYVSGLSDHNFIWGSNDLSSLPYPSWFMGKLDPLTGNPIWLKAYNNYYAIGYAPKIHACRNGDFYLAISYQGTILVDSSTTVPASTPGGFNVFVAKYDTNCNVIWYGISSGEAILWGAALDGYDNLFISGYLSGSFSLGSFTVTAPGERAIFCAKIGPSGSIGHMKKIASGPGIANVIDYQRDGVDVDSAGNFYMGGPMDSLAYFDTYTCNTASSHEHFYVVKYDSSFSLAWCNPIGITSSGVLFSGVVRPEGKNVYAVGGYGTSISIDSVTLTGTGTYRQFFAELCDSDGSTFIPTGLDESQSEDAGWRLYPNPVSNELRISIRNKDIADYELRIYDILGKEQGIKMTGSLITTSDLVPGVYFVDLVSKDGKSRLSGRFIKE